MRPHGLQHARPPCPSPTPRAPGFLVCDQGSVRPGQRPALRFCLWSLKRLLLFNFPESVPPRLEEGQGLCTPFLCWLLLTLGGVPLCSCGVPTLAFMGCAVFSVAHHARWPGELAGWHHSRLLCTPQGTGEVWIPIHPPTAHGEPAGRQGSSSPGTFFIFSNPSVPCAVQLPT